MKTVLTIAGHDPSSGAGVTADLMVFAAHGLFGTSCITSLTVQSTLGVRSTSAIEPGLIAATLDCLESDLPPTGIKIGMLGTADAVRAVSDYLERVRSERPSMPVVLDPVLRSSSGRELLDERGRELMKDRLLPLVDWVTPNLEELSVLCDREVVDRVGVLEAAPGLRSRGERLNVMATGGHLEPPDDLVWCADDEPRWLPGVKIESRATHGTGCALSSALLSQLVLGESGCDAARRAKEYVAEAIRRAAPLGHGHGPVSHLWPLTRMGILQ